MIGGEHEVLERLAKIGDDYPRVQRCMEFLSAYEFKLGYQKRWGYVNDDFLSCPPVEVTQWDINGNTRPTYPNDVDVYFVGASGL